MGAFLGSGSHNLSFMLHIWAKVTEKVTLN